MALPEVGVRISSRLDRSAISNLRRYREALDQTNAALRRFSQNSGTFGRALQQQAAQSRAATSSIVQSTQARARATQTAITQQERQRRQANAAQIAQRRVLSRQLVAQERQEQQRLASINAAGERQRQRANQAQIRQRQVQGRQVQREQVAQQRLLERTQQRQFTQQARQEAQFQRQLLDGRRAASARLADNIVGGAAAAGRGIGRGAAGVGRGVAGAAQFTAQQSVRGLQSLGSASVRAAGQIAQTRREAAALRQELNRQVVPATRTTTRGLGQLTRQVGLTGRGLRNLTAGSLTGVAATFGGINALIGTTALSFGNVGFAAAAGLGAGLSSVVREGANFQQALTNAASVSANLGDTLDENGEIFSRQGEGIEQLKAQFRDFEGVSRRLGRTTTFTASQAAEGLVFLSRAGLSTEAATGSLEQTIRFAEASLGELGLADAANLATNAMSAFGLRGAFAAEAALNVTRTTDAMTAAANNSNTSVGQLAQALSFAGTIANDLSIPVEATSAAIGVLGNNGVFATRAGRGLRQALQRIFKPTEASAGAFEVMAQRIGLTGDSLFFTNGQFVGLTEALTRVERATRGLTEQDRLRELGVAFETIGGAAIRPLLSNLDQFNDILGVASTQQGVLEKATRDFLEAEGLAIDETLSLSENLAKLEREGQLSEGQISRLQGVLREYSTTARQATAQQDTLTGDTIKFRSALSSLAITLSGSMNPGLRDFVQGATAATLALDDVINAAQNSDDAFGVFGAAIDGALLNLAAAADARGLRGIGDALVAIAQIDVGAALAPAIANITTIGSTARSVVGDVIQIGDALVGLTARGLTGQDIAAPTFQAFEGLDSLASTIEQGLTGALSVAGIEVDLTDLVTFTGLGEGEPTPEAFQFEVGDFLSFTQQADKQVFSAGDFIDFTRSGGDVQVFAASQFISFSQTGDKQVFSAGDFLTFTRDRATGETQTEVNLDELLPGLGDVETGLRSLGEAVPGTEGFGLAVTNLSTAIEGLGVSEQRAEGTADLLGDLVAGIGDIRGGLEGFNEAAQGSTEATRALDGLVTSLGGVTATTESLDQVSSGLQRLGVSAGFAGVLAPGLANTSLALTNLSTSIARIREADPDQRLGVIGEELAGAISPISESFATLSSSLQEEGVAGVGARLVGLSEELNTGLTQFAGTIDEVDGAETATKISALTFGLGGLALVANTIRTDVLQNAVGGVSTLLQSTINLGTEIVEGLETENVTSAASTFVANVTTGVATVLTAADVPGIAQVAANFTSALSRQFALATSRGEGETSPVVEAATQLAGTIFSEIGGALTDPETAEATGETLGNLSTGVVNLVSGAFNTATGALAEITADDAVSSIGEAATAIQAALDGFAVSFDTTTLEANLDESNNNIARLFSELNELIRPEQVTTAELAAQGDIQGEQNRQFFANILSGTGRGLAAPILAIEEARQAGLTQAGVEQARDAQEGTSLLTNAVEFLSTAVSFNTDSQLRNARELANVVDPQEITRAAGETADQILRQQPSLAEQQARAAPVPAAGVPDLLFDAAGQIQVPPGQELTVDVTPTVGADFTGFDFIGEGAGFEIPVEPTLEPGFDFSGAAFVDEGQFVELPVRPTLEPGFDFSGAGFVDEGQFIELPVRLRLATDEAGLVDVGDQEFTITLLPQFGAIPAIPPATQQVTPELTGQPQSTFAGFMRIETEVEDFQRDFTGTLRLRVSRENAVGVPGSAPGEGPAISAGRTGTLFWKGGRIRVAEGNNPELIRLPNGGAIMAMTDQVIDLPTASQIFSTQNTERILGVQPASTEATANFAPGLSVPGVDLSRAVNEIVVNISPRGDSGDSRSRSRSESRQAAQEAVEEIAQAVSDASAAATIGRAAAGAGRALTGGSSGSRGRGSIGGGNRALFDFAKGTDNAPPGYALVGEAGREFVIGARSSELISHPTIMRMEGGEKVIRNDQTERILSTMGTVRPPGTVANPPSQMMAASTSSVDNSKHLNINVHPSHFNQSDAHSLQHVANLLH